MKAPTVDLLREGTRVDVFEGGLKVSKACCSAVVLIRAQGRNVVVDSGAMGYADAVLSALGAVGLKPSDVDTVVNTHMHLDHIYNNYLFKKAVIYTPTSVWHVEDGNRVEMFPGVTDPGIRGVSFMDTPGHMEKHVAVAVRTAAGMVVIAGDAVRESVIDGGEVPRKYPLPHEYLESMRRIFDAADEIIPGHGPPIRGERLKRLRVKLKTLKQ